MKQTRLAGLTAGALAVALTGVGATATSAAAEPLPAEYSGTTHGDMVSMELAALSDTLTSPELARTVIGHSQTTTDSTATPATYAESANLHAAVAGLDLAIQSGSAAAPDGRYSDDFGQVNVEGLLDTGLISGEGEANFVSTTECVPVGTPLTSSTTSLASLDLGIGESLLGLDLDDQIVTALSSIVSMDTVQTSGTTYLDGTSVVSEQTADLAAIELLGGLAVVNVESPVTLTATSDGTAGTIAYSNPSATVDLDGDTVVDVTLGSNESVTIPLSIDIPLVGSLLINLTLTLAPDDPSGDTGPTASAEVPSVLSIDMSITATDGVALALGDEVADVSLGISPMSVSATAPTGGVECDAVDSDGDGPTDEEEADPGTDPDNPDTDGPTDGEEVNDDGTGPDDPDADDGGVNDGTDLLDGSDDLVGPGGGDSDGAGDSTVDGVLPATGGPAGTVLMLLLGLASLGGGAWLLRRGTALT